MPNKNNNNRMGRIGEEYKKELSQIIDRELKDPSITGMISKSNKRPKIRKNIYKYTKL